MLQRPPHSQTRHSGDPEPWRERAAAWLPQSLREAVAIAGILILGALVIALILTTHSPMCACGGGLTAP
jgi:hypothetical protein